MLVFIKTMLGLNLIKNELYLQFINIKNIVTFVVFIIISSFLLSFFILDKQILSQFAAVFIWVILIFACQIFVSNAMEKEYTDGILTNLALQSQLFEIVIFSKIIATIVVVQLSVLFCLPLLSLFFDIDFHNSVLIAYSILLGIPSIVSIIIASSSLLLGSSKRAIITPILSSPLIIPCVMISILYINDAQSDYYYKTILVLLFALFLPISIIQTSVAIRSNL